MLHHVSSLMFLLFFRRHHCRCHLYPHGVPGLCRHLLSSCLVPPPAWSWPFSSPHAFPEASTTHNICSDPKTLDLPARPCYLTLSVQSPGIAEPDFSAQFSGVAILLTSRVFTFRLDYSKYHRNQVSSVLKHPHPNMLPGTQNRRHHQY